jgi:hypothetical protein
VTEHFGGWPPILGRLLRCALTVAALVLLPAATADGLTARVDQRGLESIACPSVSQCTGTDADGRAVTFNPRVRGRYTPVRVDRSMELPGLGSISCPTSRQCTASDRLGNVITFDPRRPHTAVLRVANPFPQLVCPSITECVAANIQGGVWTFDPRAPDRPYFYDLGVGSLACPRVWRCVAIAGDEVVTYDPQTHVETARLKLPRGMFGLACQSLSQCSAINAQTEITFDPQSGRRLGQAVIEPASRDPMVLLACSGVHICVAIDDGTRYIGFDPSHPNRRRVVWLEPSQPQLEGGNHPTGLSCPSRSQCTMSDAYGRELTFRPAV